MGRIHLELLDNPFAKHRSRHRIQQIVLLTITALFCVGLLDHAYSQDPDPTCVLVVDLIPLKGHVGPAILRSIVGQELVPLKII